MGAIRPIRIPAVAAVVAWLALCLPRVELRADGWHGAAMATASLDEWLNKTFADLKTSLPDIKEQLRAAEATAGTNIADLQKRAQQAGAADDKSGLAQKAGLRGKLSAQQQMLLGRKAADCLEILGCMNPQNIFPAEFPNFPMQQIPRYRDAAKQLLTMMGSAGGSAVTATLRSELMGSSPVASMGLQPAATYYTDLLEILKKQMAAGNVSHQDIKDLLDAASGQKVGVPAQLAKEIQKLLADLEGVPIRTILEWAAESTDSKTRTLLYSKIRSRVKEASLNDLLAIASSKADSATKQAAARELESRWSQAGPLELLIALETINDPQVRRNALAALAQKSPTYAEVKADLPEIWKRLKSEDPQVAAAARDQLVNAYLRAPIPECLEALARGDAEQDKLIWEQLDDRISRADADRRDGYRGAALEAVKDSGASSAVRTAGLDLISRMKDRQAAGELVEALALLPQDLRPKAGKTLKDITGQNFGPQFGDGTAEVAVAIKKWRDWLKANGGR
jgi:hypothetical protein